MNWNTCLPPRARKPRRHLINWGTLRRATPGDLERLAHKLSFEEARRLRTEGATQARVWVGRCTACGETLLIEIEAAVV